MNSVEVAFMQQSQTFRPTDYRDLSELSNSYGPFEIRDVKVKVFASFSVRPDLLQELLELNYTKIKQIAKERGLWQ